MGCAPGGGRPGWGVRCVRCATLVGSHAIASDSLRLVPRCQKIYRLRCGNLAACGRLRLRSARAREIAETTVLGGQRASAKLPPPPPPTAPSNLGIGKAPHPTPPPAIRPSFASYRKSTRIAAAGRRRHTTWVGRQVFLRGKVSEGVGLGEQSGCV